MIKIGVTGTGSLIGQAIIKCIKRSENFSDTNIVGFDYLPGTPGSYWVNSNYILPDILNSSVSPQSIVERVIEIIDIEKIQILFIGIDFDLSLYAEYRSYIEEATGCRVFVSDTRVVEIADDKFKTFKFLERNLLNHPKTFLYSDFNEQIDFPVILKPAVGAGSKDVSIVKDRSSLDQRAKNINNPIIQELIGNAENEYTCGVLTLDDKIIDTIVLQRQLHKGNTSKAIFRFDFPKAIYEYIEEVTNILKPRGVCNYQLRMDQNGVPKIFEINARHSGTTYFRTLFGYNELDLILQHFYPKNDFKRSALREGVAIRYFEETFVAI